MTTTVDANRQDTTVESEVFPGIPNDAQICEMTRPELTQLGCYIVARARGAVGADRGELACRDGGTLRGYYTTPPAADIFWRTCEMPEYQVCGSPVGPLAHCFGARVEICLFGSTPALESERDRYCAVSAPPGCTIDRSLAYREP